MAAAAAAAGPGPGPAEPRPPPSDLFRQVGQNVFKLYSEAAAAAAAVAEPAAAAAVATSKADEGEELEQAASGAGAGTGTSQPRRQKGLRSFICKLQNAIKARRDRSSLTEHAGFLAEAVGGLEAAEVAWRNIEVARYAAKVVRDLQLCMLVSPSIEYAVCMVGAAELVLQSKGCDVVGCTKGVLNHLGGHEESQLGRAACAFIWSLYGALKSKPSDVNYMESPTSLHSLVEGVLSHLPWETDEMLGVWVEEVAVSVATYVVLLRASGKDFKLYCDDLGDRDLLTLKGEGVSRSSPRFGVPDLVWIHDDIQLLVEVKLCFVDKEKFYFPMDGTNCTKMKPSDAVDLVYWSQLCPYVKAWLDPKNRRSYSSMHGLVLMGCVPKQGRWSDSCVKSKFWEYLNGDNFDAALSEAAKKYSHAGNPIKDCKLKDVYGAAMAWWDNGDTMTRIDLRIGQDGLVGCYEKVLLAEVMKQMRGGRSTE